MPVTCSLICRAIRRSQGAHLYVSGIKAGTKDLFYFDIPMDKPATDIPVQK